MSYVSTGLRPSLASNSLPSLSPSSDPPKHSSAQPAEVPGATNTIIQLPSTTHGFAASWLRLASVPSQPATRLSQPHPSPSAYLASSPPHQPGLNQRLAQPSPPAGQACLTCLRPSPAIAQPSQCGCPARRKLASAQPTTHASKVQPSCPRLASGPAQAYLMCLRLACGPAQPGEAGLSDLSGASFRYSDLPNTGFRCS